MPALTAQPAITPTKHPTSPQIMRKTLRNSPTSKQGGSQLQHILSCCPLLSLKHSFQLSSSFWSTKRTHQHVVPTEISIHAVSNLQIVCLLGGNSQYGLGYRGNCITHLPCGLCLSVPYSLHQKCSKAPAGFAKARGDVKQREASIHPENELESALSGLAWYCF